MIAWVWVIERGSLQALPFRSALAKMHLGQRLVDDHNGLAVGAVLRAEEPAFPQLRADGLEIIFGNGADQGILAAEELVVLTLDQVAAGVPDGDQGKVGGERCGLDAGQRFHFLDHAAQELLALGMLAIARSQERRGHGQQTGRMKSRIHLLEFAHGLDQQSGAGGQHQGQGHLYGHQHAAQPVAAGCLCPSAFLERFKICATPCQPRGRQTEEQRRDHRHAHGEERDPPIEVQLRGLQIFRNENAQDTQAPERENQAGERASGRQQHALQEHLLDQAPASCAQRGANCQLPLTRLQASQQQVGQIGAGNQQHACRGTKQRHQGQARLADDLVAHGNHHCANLAVAVGVLLFESFGDARHFGLRLLHGRAGAQPRDAGEKV